MSEDANEEQLIAKVLRDIGVSQEEIRAGEKESLAVFQQILQLPSTGFKRLGLDTAVTAGSFGDWPSALLLTERLLKEGDHGSATKLWHIRALFETEHYSEAVARLTPVDWPPQLKIHADFLTGQCYLKLNMKPQAEAYFEAVKASDPHYPGLPARDAL